MKFMPIFILLKAFQNHCILGYGNFLPSVEHIRNFKDFINNKVGLFLLKMFNFMSTTFPKVTEK